jgi:hypothetical protein
MASRFRPNARSFYVRRAMMLDASESLRLLLEDTDDNDKLAVGVEMCLLAMVDFDSRCNVTHETQVAFKRLTLKVLSAMWAQMAPAGEDDPIAAAAIADSQRVSERSETFSAARSNRELLLAAVRYAIDALLITLDDQHVTADAVCLAVLLIVEAFLTYAEAGDGLSDANWLSLAHRLEEFLAAYDPGDDENDADDDDGSGGPDNGPDDDGPAGRPTVRPGRIRGNALPQSMRITSRPARFRRSRSPSSGT